MATTPEPVTVGCVNCGQPAKYRETNPGANRNLFCATCAEQIYGLDSEHLEPL